MEILGVTWLRTTDEEDNIEEYKSESFYEKPQKTPYYTRFSIVDFVERHIGQRS